MLNKLSIRMKLSIMTILMLSVCCLGITALLNFSASQMAVKIEATLLSPAYRIQSDKIHVPQQDSGLNPSVNASSINASKGAQTQFFHMSIWYMVLVVAMGGALTYYISGKVLKPLQILGDEMKNRTVHNLSLALSVPQSKDEIADLTHAFNQMSEKLEESFAVQRRFSQSAAHELRTPLTVIKTKIDVFRKKKNHTLNEYDSLFTAIVTHTNRLSDLVKDLLELTNIDALDCDEKIVIDDMIADIVDELSPIAQEKGVTITIEGMNQQRYGNSNLLHRAFYNIIENAIKYNVAKGTVLISISMEDERCKVSFADSGIGISLQQQDLIFEPFYRIDKSRSRQMGGAGLGLSIARTIIEKHQGTIQVQDNNGKGTVFIVNL